MCGRIVSFLSLLRIFSNESNIGLLLVEYTYHPSTESSPISFQSPSLFDALIPSAAAITHGNQLHSSLFPFLWCGRLGLAIWYFFRSPSYSACYFPRRTCSLLGLCRSSPGFPHSLHISFAYTWKSWCGGVFASLYKCFPMGFFSKHS